MSQTLNYYFCCNTKPDNVSLRDVVSRDTIFSKSWPQSVGIKDLKSQFRLGTLNFQKMGMSQTSGTIAVIWRFYKTAAAYGRFYTFSYSASGRMRNLSFYMNFKRKK